MQSYWFTSSSYSIDPIFYLFNTGGLVVTYLLSFLSLTQWFVSTRQEVNSVSLYTLGRGQSSKMAQEVMRCDRKSRTGPIVFWSNMELPARKRSIRADPTQV